MMSRYSDRRYRRYSRRQWQRGGYPVMLIGTAEPLGLIAVAAAGKWLFRHRSAFAPFGIAVAEFAVAGMVHQHHARWWIAVLCSTVVTSVILGIPHRIMRAHPSMKFAAGIVSRAWEACGIDRPAERAYAAIAIAAGGGWLTAAIADGPAMKPLPAIAFIATVALGIPWWAHRRRRARVRAVRTIQAWPGLAENMGLPGSRIASIVIDAWGWTARVILRKGTTAAHAISQLPAIESGLGIRPGTARAIPDPARADRIVLRVIEKDPHAEPIPWREPEPATITKPVDIGLHEDGSPVLVDILRRHVLIAGTTGTGKSVIENGFVAALAKCEDAEQWGIDMKGGMELQPWADCLRHLATTPERATALLALGVARLDQRAAELAGLRLRVHEPTPADPAIVILIDEFAELPPEALEHADSIARRGRAVAVTLIAVTQRPTQDAMGGNAVRSQMDVRICLRVRERRDTDLILGQGALTAGWDAHALTQPGTFLLSDPEHTTPERARAYLITDDQVTRHAARYAITRGGTERAEPYSDGLARRDPYDEPAAQADAAGVLWDALCLAGPRGVTPQSLAAATGMGRTWVHQRLREHAMAGRALQVRYGRWRASEPPGSVPGSHAA